MKIFEYKCGICEDNVKLTVYAPIFKGQIFRHCPSCFILHTCPPRDRFHELSEVVKRLRAAEKKEQALLYKRALYLRRLVKIDGTRKNHSR